MKCVMVLTVRLINMMAAPSLFSSRRRQQQQQQQQQQQTTRKADGRNLPQHPLLEKLKSSLRLEVIM